jgi:hypothetical protein
MAACGSPASSTTFSFTATTTGDGVLFAVGCGTGGGTPSSVTLTASGWATTQIGTLIGNTTAGFFAAFKAYAPNTSAATFTLNWGASCGGFMNDLIDEFAGMDATNFVDASNSATANSVTSCNSVSVTPTVSNDGLWAACNDNQTAAGASWTKGADDTQSDIAVWRVLVGGSGVSQSPGFSSSTGTVYTVFMVAIKPAGAASCTPTLALMGVGRCGQP